MFITCGKQVANINWKLKIPGRIQYGRNSEFAVIGKKTITGKTDIWSRVMFFPKNVCVCLYNSWKFYVYNIITKKYDRPQACFIQGRNHDISYKWLSHTKTANGVGEVGIKAQTQAALQQNVYQHYAKATASEILAWAHLRNLAQYGFSPLHTFLHIIMLTPYYYAP